MQESGVILIKNGVVSCDNYKNYVFCVCTLDSSCMPALMFFFLWYLFHWKSCFSKYNA